ncbi:MAG: alpha/beta hydrolase [Rhodospirillaceae bacterium]|jgi:pimeloyl-ACP methyl ester carboxylesterase|nr:alpha/beta hydrolase [Rhodospirillaceae bacterium]MBT5239317.1 alpha/beta hydrolase [Rhodospirillaceae bacterium]MBT5566335.1 alpha/beta hydrolase [Rhodospirillaceae bacterium]MBT6088428.1 alpha/beta hydrolase [Rhodospirillaceae bacterium]MBT6960194.1 alpha/beta hydrolase [Rhodospirillaceae bacterium]
MAPESIDRRYLQTPFGNVHYWVTGNGPFLTLIHQSAQSSEEYVMLAAQLADSFRVVGIDLPGHGKSSDPDHELKLEELTDVALAVLDELGAQRTHILGHHGGVSVSIDLSNRYSDRVDKVVMSGGGTRSSEQLEALKNTPMTRDLPLDSDGDFLSQTWAVYRKMSASKTPPDVTVRPFAVGLQARLRPFDMHHALYRWDGEKAREVFDKETLLIRGKEDLYSGDVAARHKQMANSTYVEIADGGAWLFYEQPEACAKVVRDFLAA